MKKLTIFVALFFCYSLAFGGDKRSISIRNGHPNHKLLSYESGWGKNPRDPDIPIQTYKGHQPTERELAVIMGVVKDDFLINDDVTGEADQKNPSITMDDNGNFVIVWYDNRNDTSGWDTPDIYYQQYNAFGLAHGGNVRTNDDSGTARQGYPSIAMDSSGNFVIVWQDYLNGGSNPDIIGQRYHSDGSLWGVNYRIVADEPNHGEEDPVAIANASAIIFSWMDNRRSNAWDIYGKIATWDWDGVTSVEEPIIGNPHL